MHGTALGFNASPGPVTVAIIGGGFTGAAIAFQLARVRGPWHNIAVFDPRPVLGAGLAYGTTDPMHRLNAPAARMSLLPEDADHFARWIATTGACLDDPAAALPDGRLFARRATYGRYIATHLAPLLAAGRIQHITTRAETIQRTGNTWSIGAAGQASFVADLVILATGHAAPERPAALAAAFADHPRFIADPCLPGALAEIRSSDRILIVGTGLTMADVVASLGARNHTGPIHAISRRGQAPREHATTIQPMFGNFTDPPSTTACALLRRVRATLALAATTGASWQSVFDALRCQGQTIWAALPPPERRRLLRHLRPYWDAHRYRLPPQLAPVLAQKIADGTLTIRAASIVAAERCPETLRITLRPRGAAAEETRDYDAVIITTGPGRSSLTVSQPLLANLARDGWIEPDATGLGLNCDHLTHAINSAGQPVPSLLIAGPLARGTFGEITGVPEIAKLAAMIAAQTGLCEAAGP